MKVFFKKRYSKELSRDVADGVLRALGLPCEYEEEYIGGDGRNLIIETDGRCIFVIVSRKSADSRNAFLAQYVPTVLEQYVSYPTTKQKSIYIYLLDASESAKTPFITDTYRVCKTLGIEILNEAELGMRVEPYGNFAEWRNAKTSRQRYNPANQSSYAIEDENGYTVYGKLYGANGKEAALIACVLAVIARREGRTLNFIRVTEHGAERISDNDGKLLKFYGVKTDDGAIVLNAIGGKKSTCRKQDEFKFNLLQKYGGKKCYLCDCDIETNIIASHIHRITDIDNSDLTPEEKRRQAVDADNGFWLCANHDKMFENGVITFGMDRKLKLNPSLTPAQTRYIKRITEVDEIEGKHFTAGLKIYLSYHNDRVKL